MGNLGVYIYNIVHYKSKLMIKTRIIGHRGAAGLALENTIPSFEKAVEVGAQTIEFDVHTTKDGQFVVCHNEHLKQVSTSDKSLKDLTYEELKQIPLHNGAHVPLLREVLDLAKANGLAVIVEIKTVNNTKEFCNLLDEYKKLDVTVACFKYKTLAIVRRLRPDYKLYLGEQHRPIAALQEVKALKGQGVDLHYMLINPLTYWLAQRWKMDIMLYTINNRFLGNVITMLYPKVVICTDRPDYFIRTKSGKAV